MPLNLIHIPKTGGTSIEFFLDSNNIKYTSHHLVKMSNPLDDSEKYITIIRNPIARFVSAFNYYFSLVSQNLHDLSYNKLNLDNCLSPYFTKKKMVTNYYFDPFIDDLILHFETANKLAESLSSEDINIKNKARSLCGYNHFAGIGFYLDKNFINTFHKNIVWVGILENIDNDIRTLCKTLDIKDTSKMKKIRENKNNHSKYLSDKAIQNLLEFYNDDYISIELLQKYNLIDSNILNSYREYSNSS